MKGWIQRSRYKRELVRRAEAASKIQAGVCLHMSIVYVDRNIFDSVCDHRDTVIVVVK